MAMSESGSTNLHDGRFLRIERMIGTEGLRRIQQSRVTVIGLGAVGSYATEALARAGVGRLRLVDFDRVQISNINRQLYALQSTLGMAKAEVARRRVLEINPDCDVEAMECFVHTDTLTRVLEGEPDVVIDAIDSLTPKVELLAEVSRRGLGVVSSMGAALRTDPTCVRVGPLSEVHHCPLASKIRKRLRQRGASVELTCVYSIEPVGELNETAIDREGDGHDQTEQRGRRRQTLGSLPTLTGIFGLTAANTTIRMLLDRDN